MLTTISNAVELKGEIVVPTAPKTVTAIPCCFRSQFRELVCAPGLRVLLLPRDGRGIHELRKGEIVASFMLVRSINPD